LEEVVRAASQRLEHSQSQFADKGSARIRIEEAEELIDSLSNNLPDRRIR
jgi:hypothetical protein